MLVTFLTPLAIGLLLTLGFGVWLGLRGQPYHGWLFNIHKLIALGIVVFTIYQLYQLSLVLVFPAEMTALLIIAALCVVVLFTTGALMSIGVVRYRLWRAIHIVAPILLVAALAGVAYWLAIPIA